MHLLSLVIRLFWLGLKFESGRLTNSQQVQQVPGLLLWNSSLPANQKLTKGKRNLGVLLHICRCLYMFIYIHILEYYLNLTGFFFTSVVIGTTLVLAQIHLKGLSSKGGISRWSLWVNWCVGFSRSSDIFSAAQIIRFPRCSVLSQ